MDNMNKQLFKKSLSIKVSKNLLDGKKFKMIFSTWKIDEKEPLIFSMIGDDLDEMFKFVSEELKKREISDCQPMFYDPNTGKVKENKQYETNSSPEGISREQKPDSVAGRVQD